MFRRLFLLLLCVALSLSKETNSLLLALMLCINNLGFGREKESNRVFSCVEVSLRCCIVTSHAHLYEEEEALFLSHCCCCTLGGLLACLLDFARSFVSFVLSFSLRRQKKKERRKERKKERKREREREKERRKREKEKKRKRKKERRSQYPLEKNSGHSLS